jgi:hypothetical protein
MKIAPYREVRVAKPHPEKVQYLNALGAVFGYSEDEEDGRLLAYGVFLFGPDIVVMFRPDEVEETGKAYTHGDFYSGETIRVRVDKNGRGEIV